MLKFALVWWLFEIDTISLRCHSMKGDNKNLYDMKATKLFSIINDFRLRCKNVIESEVGLSDIEMYVCNSYIQLSFENDDVVINCELSHLGDDIVLTGFEVIED